MLREDSLGTGASQEIHRLPWTLHSKAQDDGIHDAERSYPQPSTSNPSRPDLRRPTAAQFSRWSSMTRRRCRISWPGPALYEGWEVQTANDGMSAPRAAREFGPDAVVLDVMLPDMTGLRSLAQLRDTQPNVPVLFLTAKDAVEDRVAGLTAGGDDMHQTIQPGRSCGPPARFGSPHSDDRDDIRIRTARRRRTLDEDNMRCRATANPSR